MPNRAIPVAATIAVLAAALATAIPTADARGWPGGRMAERIERRSMQGSAPLPAGVRALRDQAYGDDPAQRYDVYIPANVDRANATRAPVLFFVHGGGWRRGDKVAGSRLDAKLAHWTAKGYVVISTNYRMLPEADPLEQARDVARAVASAQRASGRWGADAGRFVLMGHSAGAHLVALLTASPALLRQAGAQPVRGGVMLDGAAFDVERLMAQPHFKLFDAAFGDDRALWRAASPLRQLSASGVPMLAVCSSRRRDSCAQAHAFAAAARRIGRDAQVLEQDLGHAAINEDIGKPSAYTEAVDRFVEAVN